MDSPDRRQGNRGAPFGESTRQQLTATILGCYNDLPGLSLHLQQSARLFGLRLRTCELVLNDLVRAGRLRREADGQHTASLPEASPASERCDTPLPMRETARSGRKHASHGLWRRSEP